MFERLKLLIGEDNLNEIKGKTVLIVGVGGVGGYAVTSLARSGVENLIIIDYDKVDISNINRQIIAYHSTIGKKKVDALEQMLLDINPNINVVKYDTFITPDNINDIFDKYKIDYIVDACDSMPAKKAIIDYSLSRNVKLISSMGTGNKLDPTKLEITDIRKTNNDPVARILRKYVKDKKINKKITVLCSTEVPKKVGNVVSSNSFVPSSAGLIITSYIINDIITKKEN